MLHKFRAGQTAKWDADAAAEDHKPADRTEDQRVHGNLENSAQGMSIRTCTVRVSMDGSCSSETCLV